MFHVGLDIHTRRISIRGLDEKGQVVHRPQVRSIEELVRTFVRMVHPWASLLGMDVVPNTI
jgi:hypothetical protein